MKLKKNDRVEFKFEGKLLYGVVSRGGAKNTTVIIDGGTQELKGSIKFFRLSEKPISTDEPSAMDKWSVKSYKEIEGHGDSPTFSAKICLNEKPVIRVGNNGWGGCNEYHCLNLKIREKNIDTQFYADVKSWVKQFGDESMYDAEDFWVEWYQFSRPYSVTAKQSIEEFNDKTASFSK